MHQDMKQQRKSDFKKFKELWFLLFMLLFTLLHNVMAILMGENWSFIGYSILFLALYGSFRWLRLSVAFLRKPLSWGCLIGIYLAGVVVLGIFMVP